MRCGALGKSAVAAAAFFAVSAAAALDPIVIKVRSLSVGETAFPMLTRCQGSKFFYKTNGTELYVLNRLYADARPTILTCRLGTASSRELHTRVRLTLEYVPSVRVSI